MEMGDKIYSNKIQKAKYISFIENIFNRFKIIIYFLCILSKVNILKRQHFNVYAVEKRFFEFFILHKCVFVKKNY